MFAPEEKVKTVRGISCTLALAIFVMSATIAHAQGGGPTIQVKGAAAQLNLIFKTGPKGTQTAPPVTPEPSTGAVALPPGLLSPDKPHTRMIVYQCPDGVYIVAEGMPDPCPQHSRRLGAFWWDTGGKITIDLAAGTVTDSSVSTAASAGAAATSELPFTVQVDAFGGAGWPHGNTAAKYGGGLAFLFPVGDRVGIGPVVYGEYEAGANIGSFGGSSGGTTPGVRPLGTTGSTFERTDLRAGALFAGARFEGSATDRFKVDFEIGAFPTWAKVTTIEGVCGPTGCTTFPSSLGPERPENLGWSVGVGASFALCDHVALFGRYNRDEVNAGSEFDGLNQFAFGVRLSIK